ncbi:hypothetical protein C1280_24985 [Gemmata obscuriglobus]|uniref:Uncharacterized protein n=1 Tax=Gemmata obscuriglobus TaxID=114 RepID=A0A2Z3H8M2_9BACT|nr:hypothetical protein C1280_24985 [Gemmata obscuriglobus]
MSSSAARANAAPGSLGRPSSSAAGGAALFCARNHGSASRHAPFASTTRPPATVTARSSHTHPHTVQPTSVKVRG